MTVVGISPSLPEVNLAVPLARYAQIIGYSEAAFFGVAHPDNTQYACRTIWTHWQRMDIYRVLQMAQEMIEKEAAVNYDFIPTYHEDEEYDIMSPVIINGKVIAMGRKAIANVSLGETVDHTNDPAVVVVNGIAFTNPDEVVIYHPGTDFIIDPSSITIAGGTLTIEIPRVRLVTVADEDNDDSGLDYSDLSLFEATVDVKRIYTDTTDVGVLVCHECVNGVATEDTTPLSAYIQNAELGIVYIDPCNCVSCGNCACGLPRRKLRLNYLAGAAHVSNRMEDAVIRLAHALLPDAPCGCDFLKEMWNRDQKIPDVLTAERENCPFGMSNGAWTAWTFAQGLRQMGMSIL